MGELGHRIYLVENSEETFFKHYFNQFLLDNYALKVEAKASGTGGKCKITDFKGMVNRIETALEIDNYKAVFIMIDLDSKCFSQQGNHKCLKKLKKEYLPKYSIKHELKEHFYLFVVCNEIESWFLTIQKDTNSPYNNHKKELMEYLKLNSEPQIVAKMVQELKNNRCKLDFSKNSSLQFFIDKLKELQWLNLYAKPKLSLYLDSNCLLSL